MVDLQLESEERQCGDAKKIEREPIHIGFWTQNNMFQGQKYIVLIESDFRTLEPVQIGQMTRYA